MTVLVLVIVFEIILAIGQLELFFKSGLKWWMGLIPIYSSWVLITKIAKMNSYWFVLDLIIFILFKLDLKTSLSVLLYVVDFFVTFCICFNIAKKFKKNPIIFGIIGSIFTGLWFMCLGLDKESRYDDSIVVSPDGPFNL